jgi:hypothetical protein
LFELLESIPPDLDPQIVGCPNTVHTTEAQLAAAPYLHVAMTVTDPSSGARHLLDPGKWVYTPIALKPGLQVTANDGNIITVTEVGTDTFVLDEYKVLRDRHDTIIYSLAPSGFDIDANYIAYIRLRERYNCITSVVRSGEPPYYMKYLCDTDSFSVRLPNAPSELTLDEVRVREDTIDQAMGSGATAKALRFVEIFRNLPGGFWL